MDIRYFASLGSGKRVEMRPGIERITLSYNNETMLCYFYLKKGSKLEIHTHAPAQNGLVVKGRIRFLKGNGESHLLKEGDAYLFASMDPHGSEVLEDTELIEAFTPARGDYKI
jgi:quercetin dioxygenase-like cupin family protein